MLRPRRARSDAPYHSTDAARIGLDTALHPDSLAPEPMILLSGAENKFCDWQIARISDFEIKTVVENESDLVAESFDCGDFVGYTNILCVNSAICVVD